MKTTTEDYINKYLIGEITLKEIRQKTKLGHAQLYEIYHRIIKNNFMPIVPENALYEQRMKEVIEYRMNNFTPQEILTQIF